MTPDIDRLMQGYADGTLTPEEEAELNAWVKASPDNARAFARFFVMHDRLRDVVRLDDSPSLVPSRRSRLARLPAMIGGLAAVAAGLVLMFGLLSGVPVAASELERLIAAATPKDRAYIIRNRDGAPERTEPGRPPIDGARLFVGSGDRYVLIRYFEDGRTFVTGSDGTHGWAIPPDGAVRVTTDPLRFRGALPGNQHGIPFVDLRSDLAQLRDAYRLEILPVDEQGRHGLGADKKSPEFRGSRRIELRYDERTGVIHSMLFAGMPRARGGPSSVSVELTDEPRNPPGFFEHTAHHGPDRRVVLED